MKLIWNYVRPHRFFILAVMLIKLAGTGTELLIPYVLEHLLDHVVPAARSGWEVAAWGGAMLVLTLVTRLLNVTANRMSVRVARESTFCVRRDLFRTALNLSGRQMDQFGLPSLISRMTSDTYNVQNFVRMIQTMGIRAPIMLLGGIAVTLTMDTGLAMILCIMAPIMIALVIFVSWKGIPLYDEVQRRMDVLVRIMRENITGIRVVKALSKERDPAAFISPCDAKLTVVQINEGTHFTVKGADYSLGAFLGCRKLAAQYRGGLCLIFRLTPDDYHRYCYVDDCRPGTTRCIEGVLHTVNPVSAEYVKVYHQNTRTVTMLHTVHFGDILQIEVGAMMVGRIVNHPHGKWVGRGIEKGYFEFGGSTVVLVLPKDAVQIDPQILANSEQGAETVVRYGSRLN